MPGHDPDLAPTLRTFRVALAPAAAAWPIYAAIIAFVAVMMGVWVGVPQWLPESSEGVQVALRLAGRWGGGLVACFAVAHAGWQISDALRKRGRHIASGPQQVGVSSEGLHMPHWGVVPWHEVACIEGRTDDDEPTGSWHLDLFRSGDCRLGAADDDHASLGLLAAAIDRHTTGCAAARNADGSPRFLYAWRIRQSALEAFEGLLVGSPVIVFIAPFVFMDRGFFAGLAVGAAFCLLFAMVYALALRPAFMALTGYERDRLFFIEDGQLLDERRKPLLSFAENGWSLDEQRHGLQQTRPVLNFWRGRHKRLELVIGERTPGPSRQALLEALGARYGHQRVHRPQRPIID